MNARKIAPTPDTGLMQSEIKMYPQYFHSVDVDEARLYIAERYSLQREALARAVMYALEIGSALFAIQPSLKLQGRWQSWVKENCPFSVDSANNYYNLFKNLRKAPDEIFNKVNLRDLYALATDSFTDAERKRWILELQATDSKEAAHETVLLARVPELVNRVKDGSIARNDAVEIAKLIPKMKPVVRAMVLENRVSKPEVASKLMKLEKDFQGTRDEIKQHKSWFNIIENNGSLVWYDKFTGEERSSTLEDANKHTMDAYMSYRQSTKWERDERWRGRAKIINRKGQTMTLEVTLDNLPSDGMSIGSFEIDVIANSYKE